LELVKTLKASLLSTTTKIYESILFTSAINMQSNSFNVTMQCNIVVVMKAPFHVNPLIQIWCTLEASHILQYFFLEVFKLVELTIVCVGVNRKWKSFMFFFMKSKLKNHLNEHLILLWECILKLSIVSILSHMTHALINGSRSRNLGEHWIRIHNWDLGWVHDFTPIIHGPYFQRWHLMAKAASFFT
jgi:hypothetical protein